jgi:hypothetical protein
MDLEESMSTIDETPPAISPEDMAELEATIERVMKGIRDPEKMRKAAERMDRMREEMRQRVGEGEWAVDLIRETRDEE